MVSLSINLKFGPPEGGGAANASLSWNAPESAFAGSFPVMSATPSSAHGGSSGAYESGAATPHHGHHAASHHEGAIPADHSRKHRARHHMAQGSTHEGASPADHSRKQRAKHIAEREATTRDEQGSTPAGSDWQSHMDRRGIVPHQDVDDALVRRGFSHEDAAALTGNLIHESAGNQLPGHPVVLNPPTGGNSGDAAWGSAQWEGKRKRGLADPSLQSQVDHIWDEMHGSEAGAYRAMQRAKTVSEKAHIVNTLYERPLVPGASDRARRAYAEEAYRNRDPNIRPGSRAEPKEDKSTAHPAPKPLSLVQAAGEKSLAERLSAARASLLRGKDSPK